MKNSSKTNELDIEDQIDTSDIPEIDDKLWDNARVVPPRRPKS